MPCLVRPQTLRPTPAVEHRASGLQKLAARCTPLLAAAWLAGCASSTSLDLPPRPATRVPSATAATPDGLPGPVRLALQQAGLAPQSMAVLVLPAEASVDPQAPLVSAQPDRAMLPASVMKLVTSVVALDHPGVGPSARGYTVMRTRARMAGSVLQGDLVIEGGADAELGLPQMWSMLQELRYQGIGEIAGDIVLDRNLFKPARPDLGQPAFDRSPESPYNVIPDALNLNWSLHDLELVAEGDRVRARPLPPLPGVVLENLVEVGDGNCREWDMHGWQPPRTEFGNDGQPVLVLQGQFPRNCSVRAPLQLLDRNVQAEAQLRWLWLLSGGRWSGHVREGGPADANSPANRVLTRREAPPWGELLRPMNKQSSNVLARLLYQQLGVAESQRAAYDPSTALPTRRNTADWADAAVRRWLARNNIDMRGLVLDNGSGLSRDARITPRQLARLLQVAVNGRHAPDLLMSLPVAGEDGSLQKRLATGPAAGQARLKTGYLSNAASLAGVVPDLRGRRWVLVAMVNDDDAERARPALDALVEWVAGGRGD